MKIAMYDPPSGWMCGFPRPYKPLPGESVADTLRRDGYPKWTRIGQAIMTILG